MNSIDPRFDDIRITPSSGNVFVDLGFDPAEAEVMALRAEAAKRLGITQPRVSKLIRGVWQDFSLDMLLTLAARAGMHSQLKWVA